MKEKSKQEKTLLMTRLMTPDMSNFSGKVHGGTILKLLDEAAFTCASRYCKTYVVTKSLDQVEFKNPIEVGDLVTFKCNVNYVGKTSMEVGVRVEGERIREKKEYHAISSYFTMVSVNEEGKPMEVPRLNFESDIEEKLFEAGKMRCAMRKEIQTRNKKLHVSLENWIKIWS
jgi:acyl-CoA hydrolase